jgi:carbonic anhydrase
MLSYPRFGSPADIDRYAFDSARGDLFVCRLAGNFANDDTVASLEYAVAILNTPLILVLGHESCGERDDRVAQG